MSIDSLDLNILKTLISNKKHALDFANENDTALFTPESWNFANIIVTHLKTYKELPTLRIITEKLSKGSNEKLLSHVKSTWKEVDAINYDDKEFKHDLEKIKKRFAEKQLINLKDNLSKLNPGTMDINKTVSEMQKAVQNIKNLHQAKAYERKTLKEAVPVFREEYNAKMEDPTFDAGIKTGYSYLDFATDGFRPGELVLIGAESGGGKSMLLMNMAIQMWLGNNIVNPNSTDFTPANNVLYFSLEMPFKPCLNRVLSRLSGCPSKLIRNAKLNNDDAIKLKNTLKFINKYPSQFEIVDLPRNATMESIELIYEDAKASYDPKIVVIDYLGLMDYEGAEMEDWLKLGKIAEKIHEFARVHNLIVLSAVQLNRAAKSEKDADAKIGLHRIGRSAMIMQNANIAIQIETRMKEKGYPDMIYHIIKNRDGSLGKGRIIKNLACGTLIDDQMETEESDVKFEMRDPDDISQKIEALDID
jgi:replicative DNA helicase